MNPSVCFCNNLHGIIHLVRTQNFSKSFPYVLNEQVLIATLIFFQGARFMMDHFKKDLFFKQTGTFCCSRLAFKS